MLPRAAALRWSALAALVAAAVLAPLAPDWAAGRTFVCYDTLRVFAPQRWIVEEALRAFHLPLWNPFLGTGGPFLADASHGVLHPVSVLAAWLAPGDRGIDALVGGHLALAGIGAALLARELGATAGGAVAAGLAYGLSGAVLSTNPYLNLAGGASSLPLCVAGLRRFAAAPGPGALALGVGGTAAVVLSGDFQALAVAGALALALALDAAGRRGGARAVAAGLLGLAAGAVQLVPTAAHLARSVRALPGFEGASSAWALAPWRLPELVVPGLLWGPDPLLDPVFGALAGPAGWPAANLPVPLLPSVVVGLVPLALAVEGLRGGRRGWLLGALALLLLWAALGPALGADVVLGQVPVWRSFRYPEKLLPPFALAVALLAARGLDAVSAGRAPRWRVLVAGGAVAAAAAAACAAAAGRLAPDLAPEWSARALRGAWHVAAAAVALGAALALRRRLGEAGTRLAVAALVWATLAAAAPAALRPGDAEARLRAPTPALEAAPPGPRIVTPFTHEPVALEPGRDWIDQAALEHAGHGYPAYNVRGRLDSLDDYAALRPGRIARLEATLGPWWLAAAGRYAVTHVVSDRPITGEQANLLARATRGAAPLAPVGRDDVWAIPHRPWASFPAEVRVEEREEAARLATVRFVGAGRLDVAVVEAPAPLPAAPGRVHRIERGLERVRVEAEADGPATLVVADAWWPGWEATVDGVPVPIYPADGLVRAVPWPAGRHVLEMRYRPPEAALGVALSLLAVALTAAWAARLRRLGRAEPPAAA